MNSDPCVRFGIRISPKISEKPADNRNSSPPNVTLLTASTSQKFIAEGVLGCCRLYLRFERTLFPFLACGGRWLAWSESEPGEGSLQIVSAICPLPRSLGYRLRSRTFPRKRGRGSVC